MSVWDAVLLISLSHSSWIFYHLCIQSSGKHTWNGICKQKGTEYKVQLEVHW